MKVLVHGFYGAGNAGDDAILAGIIAQVRRELKPAGVVVSAYAQRTPIAAGDPGVTTVSGRDLGALHDAVMECDAVIVGGGGLFQDYHGFDLRRAVQEPLATGLGGTAVGYYGIPIFLGRLGGKPTMLYGVGVGPLRNPVAGRLAGWLGSSADAVTVRDALSAELLRERGVSGVEVTADPALALNQQESGGVPGPAGEWLAGLRDRPVIGLNLRSWAFGEAAHASPQQVYLALADHLRQKHGARFVILPLNASPREQQLAEALAFQIGPEDCLVVPYQGDLTGLLALYPKLDLMVGMRLHASVLALVSGVIPVGLAYDRKVSSFFSDLGLPELCPILDEAKPDSLIPPADDALARGPALRRRLAKALVGLRRREAGNHQELGRICPQGLPPARNRAGGPTG